MIHRCSRYPRAGAMTTLAQICGGQVRCGFPRRISPVMTAAAVTEDRAVIHPGPFPAVRVMAIITQITGADMAR